MMHQDLERKEREGSRSVEESMVSKGASTAHRGQFAEAFQTLVPKCHSQPWEVTKEALDRQGVFRACDTVGKKPNILGAMETMLLSLLHDGWDHKSHLQSRLIPAPRFHDFIIWQLGTSWWKAEGSRKKVLGLGEVEDQRIPTIKELKWSALCDLLQNYHVHFTEVETEVHRS
jgi:hypothetical protein